MRGRKTDYGRFSGVFFASDRFPQAAQPFIQALPLTQLIAALLETALTLAQLWVFAAAQLWRPCNVDGSVPARPSPGRHCPSGIRAMYKRG